MPITFKIGGRTLLRLAREASGLSQTELAELAYASRSTVQNAESGVRLSSTYAMALAGALGLPSSPDVIQEMTAMKARTWEVRLVPVEDGDDA